MTDDYDYEDDFEDDVDDLELTSSTHLERHLEAVQADNARLQRQVSSLQHDLHLARTSNNTSEHDTITPAPNSSSQSTSRPPRRTRRGRRSPGASLLSSLAHPDASRPSAKATGLSAHTQNRAGHSPTPLAPAEHPTSPYNVREIAFADLDLVEQVAGGGFCTVHLAQWRGTPVAVKRIFDPVLTRQLIAEFEREVHVLARHRHPGVVALFGFVREPANLCLVMEFMSGGSLFSAVHEHAHDLPVELDAPHVALQLAQTVAFLHGEGLAHRDIKSQNVLLSVTQDARDPRRLTHVAKLCDFGLAHYTTPGLGTPPYISPELWAQADTAAKSGVSTHEVACAADVYALGVLIAELFSGEVPFEGLSATDMRTRVSQGERPLDFTSGGVGAARVPWQWRKVIESCWTSSLDERWTASQLVRSIQAIVNA